MGFCTTINPCTGREVLVCDFCGHYPARKVRCPFGWCQAWATCAPCRSTGKTRHNSCGMYDVHGVALPHKVICKAFIVSQQRRLARYGKRYGWELTPEQQAVSLAKDDALIVQLAERYGLEYRPPAPADGNTRAEEQT